MLKSDSPGLYVATITMSADTFLQILNSAIRHGGLPGLPVRSPAERRLRPLPRPLFERRYATYSRITGLSHNLRLKKQRPL